MSGGDKAAIERDVMARISGAGVRLRLDRVVLRVTDSVRAALMGVVPDGEAVLFALSAPILQPARTAAALSGLVRDDPALGEHAACVQGNQVRLWRLAGLPRGAPKVLVLVFTAGADAGRILALAEAQLREAAGGCGRM